MLAGKMGLLPGVVSEMLQPDYWLNRTGDPNWILKPFHEETLFDLQRIEDYYRMVERKLSRGFYDWAGRPIDSRELERLLPKTELNGSCIYGLMVIRTDLKLLPRMGLLLAAPRPRDLDRNQESGLEPGEFCQIFAESADGKWLGVITRQGVGWVLRRMVAITRAETAVLRNSQLPRLIALNPEQRIKPEGSPWLITGMGSCFPAIDPFRRMILIPGRTADGGLIWREALLEGSVTNGCLAPSLPNLLRQAFKYLGFRYAWGDRDLRGPGCDCSRYVQNVLLTLGWSIPRNSQRQLALGRNILQLHDRMQEDRREILAGLPCGSLIFTDSHVLFYLGRVGERFYAIHSLYSYQVSIHGQEMARKVKRVILSDLSLGEGTTTGSLLDRLTGAVPLYEMSDTRCGN